jgi:hypothetical protein
MAEPLKQSKKALLFYKKEAKNFLIWRRRCGDVGGRHRRANCVPRRRRNDVAKSKVFARFFQKALLN